MPGLHQGNFSPFVCPLAVVMLCLVAGSPTVAAMISELPATQRAEVVFAQIRGLEVCTRHVQDVPMHLKDGGAALLHSTRTADAILRSLLVGLSTSLGAVVVLLMRGLPGPAHMAFALGLAGGVMITVSFVELWLPECWQRGRWAEGGLGAGLGVLAFLVLKTLLPEPQFATDDPDLCGASPSRLQHQHKQWRLAMLLTMALTAHNFPEGLAVAVSTMQSDRLGYVVMAAITVHNISEGIAIAMPVLEATGSRMRAFQMATFSGLAEPLGAVVAVTLLPQGATEGRGMDFMLCIVGGVMACVAFTELLPEAQAQCRPLCMVSGFLTGVAIMMLTHELA